MKRCPACSRVYDDAGLRFCLDDGTNLVDKSPAEPVPTTLVLPAAEEPVPTMKQAFPPDVPPLPDARPRPAEAVAPRKRSALLWVIAAVLLVPFIAGAVVGGLVIFKKRALTWHLMLAVDPGTLDRDGAAKQAANVIERRLDAFGVPNFRVSPQADGRIMVDLPNVTDPERVKALIATVGKLELTHVISPSSPSPVQSYTSKDEAIASLNKNGTIPPNRRVLPYVERNVDSLTAEKWVVVESPAIIDGSDLKDASASRSAYGDDYQIWFSLNKTGAAKFGAWTGANINEYLGVVLNDEVKSIAYIKSQISDQGEISGRFSRQSAEDLALVLKSGALPATIRIVEEGPNK
jgi:protein-export membrane protein SecD